MLPPVKKDQITFAAPGKFNLSPQTRYPSVFNRYRSAIKFPRTPMYVRNAITAAPRLKRFRRGHRDRGRSLSR